MLGLVLLKLAERHPQRRICEKLNKLLRNVLGVVQRPILQGIAVKHRIVIGAEHLLGHLLQEHLVAEAAER